jgi:thymidylate kinase
MLHRLLDLLYYLEVSMDVEIARARDEDEETERFSREHGKIIRANIRQGCHLIGSVEDR